MFKKNLWIAGLIVVLAIMFIGCVDEYQPPAPEGEIVTVLDLQEVLKDVPAGVLTNAKFNEVFNGTPFKPAGNVGSGVDIEILDVSGKKALKVSPHETWGSGIDVRDIATADGNTGVNYQIGDEIYIKGNAGASFQLTHGGGAYAFLDWHPAGGDFEETLVLTKKEVDDAKLAVPPNRPATIRLNNDASNRFAVFTINELVIKGYRKTGDKPEPPPPPPDFSIPATGTYAPPAGTLPYNEFYLNLGKAEFSKLNGATPVNPTASITASALNIEFTAQPQAVYIPFSADLTNLIKSAATAGYKISVTIVTTAAPTATKYRWAITNGETSSWATSNRVSDSLTGDLTNLSDQNSDPNGFLIQCNNTPLGTMNITSIKFAFVGNANPPGAIATAQKAITISFPLAGWAPVSTIDSTGVAGSVKFMPDPSVFGKFGKSTVYYAIITVTPKAGIFIPLDTEFVIKDSMSTSTVDQLSYDALTGTIITKAFDPTDATDVPNPSEGAYDSEHGTFTQETDSVIKFNLASYLTDKTDGVVTTTLTAPLVKSGDPVITLLNGGLNFTNRTSSYFGLDLNLTGTNSLGLDKAKTYKITVWGNLTISSGTPTKMQIHVPYTADPWNSADINTGGTGLTGFAKFEMTATIAPTDWTTWAAANPGGADETNRIRIRQDGSLPFRISRITVEELP
jgi:hypothetical protein